MQVGVFSTEANAQKAMHQYSSAAGRQASVMEKTSGDKTQYIVRFDGFESSESAHAFSAELRAKHNIDSFVFSNTTPTAP